MKYITLFKTVFVLLILALFVGCDQKTSTGDVDPNLVNNNKTADNPNAKNPEAVFTCNEPVWDFGKINEGEVVAHSFPFTNTGTSDLVISGCSASCGCTTPKCDKKPIAPGESSVIEIRFDSNGKTNQQSKNITVTANTNPPETILTITGFVIPKKG